MATRTGGAPAPHPEVLSHQSVELRRGNHRSPAEGACVVELASMLSGERFSDHPRSVCPVIASYMRTLNDELGDRERQELYGYAAEIVGSRGDWRQRRDRALACVSWSLRMGGISALRARAMELRLATRSPGDACAKTALRFGGPSLALALADGLLAIGRDDAAEQQLPSLEAPVPEAVVPR